MTTRCYETLIPASQSDICKVAELIKSIKSAGPAVDSGEALLKQEHRAVQSPLFSTFRFHNENTSGDWVATPGSDSNTVVIYLHGRRFQYDEPVEVFAPRLSAAMGSPVLKVNYRLAPEFPYPAALEDVLATYQALLDLSIPARRIVLVGHSSGATLALSAAIRLVTSGRPLPAAVIALSAITDFTYSGKTFSSNADKDMTSTKEAQQVREAYLAGLPPDDSPQSPLFGPFVGLPPIYIACGGNELFLDDCTRFAAAAEGVGVDVHLDVFEKMPHGFSVMQLDASAIVLDRLAKFTMSRLRGNVTKKKSQPLTLRRISWAGYVITTEHGTKVLVDPYLTGTEGSHQGIPESFVKPDDLCGVDLIAVTHAGFDHRGQSVEILKSSSAILACGLALFEEAMHKGVSADRLALMVSGSVLHYKDVTLKAVPARHYSSMTVDGSFRSDQPLGFMLSTSEGTRMFCGGDFSISEDMKTWKELYKPDIAVLGIGGVWFGPLNITELPPVEAAIAANWLGVRKVIPMHYAPGDPAPAQLRAELAEAKSDIEVVPLEFGETWIQKRST